MPDRAARAVFRLPWPAVIFPLLLFGAATPLATVRWWLLWVYLVPLLALVWIFRTRTVVTPEHVTASRLFTRTRFRWDELDRFEFVPSRWAVAVLLDARRVRLPMVRPRDLPKLTAVAGGRLLLARRSGPDSELQQAKAAAVATEPDRPDPAE